MRERARLLRLGASHPDLAGIVGAVVSGLRHLERSPDSVAVRTAVAAGLAEIERRLAEVRHG